jgi:hypothetical protein
MLLCLTFSGLVRVMNDFSPNVYQVHYFDSYNSEADTLDWNK